MPMILEGIVTTLNEDRSVNVSPMGPSVDETMATLLLRPFPSSQTYRNLARTREGVFHVIDDVELIARAAVGLLDEVPATEQPSKVTGAVLSSTCRWYEFRVASLDDSGMRIKLECDVIHAGRKRDFFGFNRAKHAVLEAAILATRLHLLPRDEVQLQWDQLRVIVEKTSSDQEHRAFQLLSEYAAEWWQRESSIEL